MGNPDAKHRTAFVAGKGTGSLVGLKSQFHFVISTKTISITNAHQRAGDAGGIFIMIVGIVAMPATIVIGHKFCTNLIAAPQRRAGDIIIFA